MVDGEVVQDDRLREEKNESSGHALTLLIVSGGTRTFKSP